MEKTTIAVDVELIKKLHSFLEDIRNPQIRVHLYRHLNGDNQINTETAVIELMRFHSDVASRLLCEFGDETGMF